MKTVSNRCNNYKFSMVENKCLLIVIHLGVWHVVCTAAAVSPAKSHTKGLLNILGRIRCMRANKMTLGALELYLLL